MTSLTALPVYDLDQGLVTRARKNNETLFNVYAHPGRAIVAGRGSKLEAEIHLKACRADKIPILRRPGGGCSVFLDPGNIIVALAAPCADLSKTRPLFDSATQWLLKGLKDLGFPKIYIDGISDVVISNQKVGGTCFYHGRNMGYFSASLLYEPDIEAMSRYLKYPPKTPEYRKGRRHSQFVTPLAPLLDFTSISGAMGRLSAGLSLHLPRVFQDHVSHTAINMGT